MNKSYLKSIQDLFEAALRKGDLRAALQAKIIEGKYQGVFNHRANNRSCLMDLRNATTEELLKIIKETS